jgi:hypothetical protein
MEDSILEEYCKKEKCPFKDLRKDGRTSYCRKSCQAFDYHKFLKNKIIKEKVENNRCCNKKGKENADTK